MVAPPYAKLKVYIERWLLRALSRNQLANLDRGLVVSASYKAIGYSTEAMRV